MKIFSCGGHKIFSYPRPPPVIEGSQSAARTEYSLRWMDIKISFILDNILYSHDDNKVESLATYNQLHSDHCPLSTGNFIIYSVSLKRFRAYTFTSQSQYEGAVSASKHKVKEVDCLKVNHKKSNHPTIVPALLTHSQYPTPIIIFTSIDTWWEPKSLTIFPIIELFHTLFLLPKWYKRYCWPDYYSYRTEARASHEKDKW